MHSGANFLNVTNSQQYIIQKPIVNHKYYYQTKTLTQIVFINKVIKGLMH